MVRAWPAAASTSITAKALVLYLAFVVPAWFALSGQEMWSDEAISLMLMGGHDPAAITPGTYTPETLGAFSDPSPSAPLAKIWRYAAERDNHTPGYVGLFSLLISAGLVPPSVQAIRIVNIAWSGLFIFAALPLLREFGHRPQWSTAAVFALSPFAIYLAREIRAYGWILGLLLTSIYLVMRYRRAATRRWLWLAAIVAVNVAGCLLHKLFIGVVAGEIAYLGLAALFRRPFSVRELAEITIAAAATLLAVLLIPNMVATTPNVGGYDAAWLRSDGGLLDVASALVGYLVYPGAWWIAPPEALLGTWLGNVFLLAFLPLALWTVVLVVRELIREPQPGPSILFLTPLAMLLALLVATGIDFSRAPRYSLIWVPVCLLWLLSRLEPGRARGSYLAYAGVASAISILLVFTGAAHRSPDRARDFVAALGPAEVTELVWVMDESLNSRGLIMSLHSELLRADALPRQFVIISSESAPPTPAPGRVITGPRRFGTAFGEACGATQPIEVGGFFGCIVVP